MSRSGHVRARATDAGGPLVTIELPAPLRVVVATYARGEAIPPHRHDCEQLVYAREGVMTVQTDDCRWVVPPQRGVWVPAGTVHSIRIGTALAMRTVYLRPGGVAGMPARCAVVRISPLLAALILRAAGFAQPYDADGPEARIARVLTDEIAAAPIAPLHLSMPTDPRARRVADALLVDPASRRDLAAWGRESGASPRTLARRFREQTGMSFGAWRQHARLLAALEKLAAGEAVTAVALDVGYESPSAFIAMFRAALGCTPGRYFS